MTDDDKNRHDLRNQLAIIRGFSELILADVGAGDPHRRDVEEIHKQSLAALDSLARMESPRADPRQ